MSYAIARSAAASVVLAASLLAAAHAASTTTFAPQISANGTTLALNGAGTRYKAVFKVYDLALYTPRKVDSVDALLALPGPKRLQFVALRELPTSDLGRLFVQGIGDNSPRETTQRHVLSMSRLIEVFSTRAKLLVGEQFAMDFVPGKGTVFSIDGKVQGEPVGDAEFFNMILRIWVGPSPADRLLKDALLGVEPPAIAMQR